VLLKKDDLTLSKLNKRKYLKKRLDAMIEALRDERLRWLIGKKKSLIEKGEMSPEEYENLMRDIMQTEMERKMIVNELKTGPLITSEISQRLQLPSKLVFEHVMALIRYNIVAVIGERNEEIEFKLL